MNYRVDHGDCIEAMRELDADSIDAIVCDPPYGIGFMGKEWDGKAIAEAAEHDRATRKDLGPASPSRPGREQPRSSSAFGNEAIIAGPVRGGIDFQAWCLAWATEALRVLKPGGHLLAFGGTRTYHRLACAVEDAGFEIRDSLIWLYGSGFPKSLDVSKAIDKAAGAEREVVGERPTYPDGTRGGQAKPPHERVATGLDNGGFVNPGGLTPVTAPATPEAERWQGWGTALKPAHEPIVVARKPLIGTVAANVLEHGTGALNVDGCRIGTDELILSHGGSGNVSTYSDWDRQYEKGNGREYRQGGRWPANVALSPEAAAELDRQSGSRGNHGGAGEYASRSGFGGGVVTEAPDDTGGASRFFYCAKASRAERNAGLDGFAEQKPHDNAGHVHADERAWDIPGSHSTARANQHPTVKPIDLMRWLVRLVTPPGGTILDPFTGSGTTGCAAVLEGFDFIGIEREAEYVEIARARIEHAYRQPVAIGLWEEAA